MRCPSCKAEFGVPRIISEVDRINEYGRREIDLTVETEDYISFNPETKTYRCSKCGHVFTIREAFLQE